MHQFYAFPRSVVFSPKRGELRFLAQTLLILSALGASSDTHAQSAPQLVSVSPGSGTTNAAPRDSVVFLFDQTMETTPLQATIGTIVIGN